MKVKKRYLPIHRVDYVHVLKGPEFKVWKPFASFGVVLSVVIGLGLILLLGTLAIYFVFNFESDIAESYADPSISPRGITDFVLGNLFLATFIPIAMVSTWAIHRIKPGFVSSVVGHFRWRWFGWCLLVIAPIWAVNFGITLGTNQLLGTLDLKTSFENPGLLALFILLMFLTTPLQATGEEYLLRGWMLQNVGAFIKDKYVAIAIAVAGFASAFIFSALHLTLNPIAWIFYFNFSVAAIVMTMKTGGLEAAVGLHIVHNVYVYHIMILFQDRVERSIIADIGTLFITLAADFVFLILVTVAVIFLAKHKNVQEEFIPNPNEVQQYNQQQNEFLQKVYFDQYQQYLAQLKYHNEYQEYYRQYYSYYYRND